MMTVQFDPDPPPPAQGRRIRPPPLAALSSLPGIGHCARAQAKPLSFQLSWIKSIQYGGYFAGIENGIFKKFGIEPTFVSGGPNVDPVANVASGQSQLGDRPIGPLIVAREKGIPIKVIGTVFQKSPYGIMSLAKTPIKTPQGPEGQDHRGRRPRAGR